MLHQPGQQKRRIERYLVSRFAIILMALGLIAIYQMSVEPHLKEPSFRYLYTLLGTYLVLGVASLLSVSRFALAGWFLPCQVTVDFIMGVLMIGVTGGVVSVFCPILFINLFSACNVLRLKGVLTYASLATLFLAATTLGYTLGYVPSISQRIRWIFKDFQVNFLFTYLVAVGIALHIVAVLGSQLSTGLLRIQKLQTEILENMSEGLIATDREGRILQINNEARNIFHLDEDAYLHNVKLSHVLDNDKYRPVLEAMKKRERWRSEVSIESPDGEPCNLEVKISTLEDERRRFRCRIGVFNDLALKKEVEEAEQRIRQLEDLYEMALGIAHEIRNPLASIRGCVQEIGNLQSASERDRGELPSGNEDCRRLVEIVCRESDRLDRIIEEFMCFTQKCSTPKIPIDLVRLIEETVILLGNHPRGQDRQIEFDHGGEAFEIVGDREKIRQVFLNLGFNALDSTTPDEGRVAISLRRSHRYGIVDRHRKSEDLAGVEVSVEDNGCGIAPEILDRIFTPFFTSKEGGTGLGLSIVHRIVHDHGGMIRVKSQQGMGTKFAVWFPGQFETSVSAHVEEGTGVAELETVS